MSSSASVPLRVALLGNPNCGKTALFNIMTGSRQKVANYAGVTVDRKLGTLHTPSGRLVEVLDLPGAYSLNAISADESVTRDIVTGQRRGEPVPDLLVCVTDATNLRLNLRLVLEARSLGLPMLLALNMSDMARARKVVIDIPALSRELGMPVLETVGVRPDGAADLVRTLDDFALPDRRMASSAQNQTVSARSWEKPSLDQVLATQAEVRKILAVAVIEPSTDMHRDDALDRIVLHPLWGMVLLAGILFLMFQAVFSWAQAPMGVISSGAQAIASLLRDHMPAGVLRSLLTDGVIAGVGGVLVFLPQILILFFFILALEDSGYLPRAAFRVDLFSPCYRALPARSQVSWPREPSRIGAIGSSRS
jgi:ferrous iron transport protein B